MRNEKHLIGQKVIVRYMEDTDSDILGLGFLITSSIMWISNRGHVFCVRGIQLGFLITSSIMWISNRGHVFCVRITSDRPVFGCVDEKEAT